MKVQYLGTGAAEGIPALFCQCETCRRASQLKGKEVRTRSGVLINEILLLDLSPDLYLHKLRYQLDLSKIQAVCVTHSHTDHFDGAELTKRSTANYCQIQKEQPLLVYGNEAVCQMGKKSLQQEFGLQKDPSIAFVPVQAFQPFFVGDLTITPIPATHDPAEACMIYLIEEGEHRMLYGNDSGLLQPKTYEFLQGKPLSLVSLDCTFGALSHPIEGHMGMKENQEVKRRLEELGCVTEETVILATHFSHNCGMGQNQLEQALAPLGIYPAWDGMVVVLDRESGQEAGGETVLWVPSSGCGNF